jgi:hypothetical protein
MSARSSRLRFRIQEVVALVVGYGMAAQLFRAFWPAARLSPGLHLLAAALYFWLGLAMSGPLLFGLESAKGRPDADRDPAESGPRRHTWAEKAWLVIGIYWLVLGALVLSSRLPDFRLLDLLLFGLIPTGAIVGLRILGSRRGQPGPPRAPWTHAAGVVLLTTWPVAWACLIALGSSVK